MSTTTIAEAEAPTAAAEAPTVHELLQEKLAQAKLGGSEKNRRKIVESGKLLVRDRLALLFDDNEYIEDGLLARFEDGLPGVSRSDSRPHSRRAGHLGLCGQAHQRSCQWHEWRRRQGDRDHRA